MTKSSIKQYDFSKFCKIFKLKLLVFFRRLTKSFSFFLQFFQISLFPDWGIKYLKLTKYVIQILIGYDRLFYIEPQQLKTIIEDPSYSEILSLLEKHSSSLSKNESFQDELAEVKKAIISKVNNEKYEYITKYDVQYISAERLKDFSATELIKLAKLFDVKYFGLEALPKNLFDVINNEFKANPGQFLAEDVEFLNLTADKLNSYSTTKLITLAKLYGNQALPKDLSDALNKKFEADPNQFANEDIQYLTLTKSVVGKLIESKKLYYIEPAQITDLLSSSVSFIEKVIILESLNEEINKTIDDTKIYHPVKQEVRNRILDFEKEAASKVESMSAKQLNSYTKEELTTLAGLFNKEDIPKDLSVAIESKESKNEVDSK